MSVECTSSAFTAGYYLTHVWRWPIKSRSNVAATVPHIEVSWLSKSGPFVPQGSEIAMDTFEKGVGTSHPCVTSANKGRVRPNDRFYFWGLVVAIPGSLASVGCCVTG